MAPLAALKLVALKLAIPLTVVEALSIVIEVAVVRALFRVTAPLAPTEPLVVPVILDIPLVPPEPPLVKQVAQVIWPVRGSSAIGPLALTATVPLAFGSVTVVLALGALGTRVILLPLVEFLKTRLPLVVLATPSVSVADPLVPTFRLPPTVMTAALSAMIESAILPDAVNLAI